MLAKDIAQRFDEKIPEDKKDLLSLPGGGEYVAGAVLCFAFGKNVSIVDSNVCRVVGRVFGIEAKGEARRDPNFRQIVDSILPEGNAKEFNWAIIDLAALICLPRKPLCGVCPLNEVCKYAMTHSMRVN